MRLANGIIWKTALLCFFGAVASLAQTNAGVVNNDEALKQDQKKPDTPPAQPGTTPPPANAAPAAGQPGKPANVVEPKLKWTGSITGGFQIIRGQTDADGVSVTGDAQYAGIARGYRFDGLTIFAKARAPISPGVSQEFTAQDRRSLYFTFYQNIHGPVFFVSRVSAEHDVLRDIRYRFMDLTGVGFRLAASQRLQAFLAVGAGGADEDKPGIRHGGVFTPGIYQRATWHISRIWTFDQWFQYRANPSNSHDYSIDGFAGLSGLIYTTHLGFQLGYIYSYEGLVGFYGGNVVPTLPYHVLSQTTVGLKFTL